MDVEMSKTKEQLYTESNVKMLRLYLCTRMKPEEQSSEEDEDITAVIDLTDCEKQGFKDSQSVIDSDITIGSSQREVVQMDETLPWDGYEHQIVEEAILASETVIFVSEGGIEDPALDDPNPETMEDIPSSPVRN